jgi:hypothetical protein
MQPHRAIAAFLATLLGAGCAPRDADWADAYLERDPLGEHAGSCYQALSWRRCPFWGLVRTSTPSRRWTEMKLHLRAGVALLALASPALAQATYLPMPPQAPLYPSPITTCIIQGNVITCR